MPEKSEKIESIESTWTVLPEKPAGPFLLEVTPEKLVVPSTGNLEVKIRNPTKETCKVYVYFDSFFWLMKKENEPFREGSGDSSSMCSYTTYLSPAGSCIFTIGYHNAEYVKYISDSEGHIMCNDSCGYPERCPEHQGYVLKVLPSERIYYNHERPEGFLVVKYGVKGAKNSGKAMREMDLFLKDETEEYKKYREQFEEIRKEQARRARWGHVLVNRDCITERKFRDLDGTIRDYGSRWKEETEWERDILPDLKQLDGFSDEQILKIRKERKEKIEEKHRKEEEEAKKRAEEYRKEQEEKRKKEEENERIKKRRKRR
ncbi:hypothetical protein CAEBREN_10085 [Caenorhabditis brenneri]|uniref:Uncharacterized protein n=1 Tax=Caenorhabditis brenneri TaxID=135651 RepID=G0MUP5_CAEBE|nr:hypothetical protein CAEBREN_10085 [Caenorhabditis brenneri]